MPRGDLPRGNLPRQKRRKRTLAESRRRRFLIVLAIVALVMIALSPLLIAGFGAPAPGPSYLIAT